MALYINNITTHAKFPLSICAGTEKQRFEMASRLTKRVYQEMEKQGSIWTLDRYKRVLDKLLAPYKINYKIMNETEEDLGGSVGKQFDVQSFPNLLYCAFANLGVKLPTTARIFEPVHVMSCNGFDIKFIYNKDGIVKDKYTVIHETRHFFDHLFNPKMSIARVSHVTEYNDETFEKIKKTHDEVIGLFTLAKNNPQNMKTFEKIVSEKLSEMPNDIRIEIMQIVRSSLKTEINAYTQELYTKLKHPIKNFYKIINTFGLLKYDFKFREKLKLANKLLREYISEARNSFD